MIFLVFQVGFHLVLSVRNDFLNVGVTDSRKCLELFRVCRVDVDQPCLSWRNRQTKGKRF